MLITKTKVKTEGEGVVLPNHFSEATFTLTNANSDIFRDLLGGTISYRLQHNGGLAWYIIDYCLMKMKCGECSEFRANYFDQLIIITLELHSFSAASDTWEMGIKEKHQLAMQMKTLGTNMLRGKEYMLAVEKYGLALKLLISDGCRGVPEDSHEEKINLIRMNISLCFMKLNIPEGVIYHSSIVLGCLKNADIANEIPKCSDHIIKTLYRRAWAFCQINEFEKSKADICEILDRDPENGETSKLLSVLESKMKEADRMMSNNLKSMFR